MATNQNTAKHTPGPWVVAPSSNPRNGSGWRDIHSVGGDFSPSYVGEALERDANLIAAAPDLLAAIKAMLDADMTTESGIEATKMARAAVAKAEAVQ